MTSAKRTVSVRLDEVAKHRLEQAAKLQKQSLGAFLEKAGEVRAREVLLEWAIGQRHNSQLSYSELAAETGLAVEEIMAAMGTQNQPEALEVFLASCRTVSETTDNPDFLKVGQDAVKTLQLQHPPA